MFSKRHEGKWEEKSQILIKIKEKYWKYTRIIYSSEQGKRSELENTEGRRHDRIEKSLRDLCFGCLKYLFVQVKPWRREWRKETKRSSPKINNTRNGVQVLNAILAFNFTLSVSLSLNRSPLTWPRSCALNMDWCQTDCLRICWYNLQYLKHLWCFCITQPLGGAKCRTTEMERRKSVRHPQEARVDRREWHRS